MKNTIKLVSLLISFLFIFTSCQAVYDVELTAPETTANPEIDLSEEYYTIGTPYHTGDIYKGVLYEGCLLFIESITTTGITGYSVSGGVTKYMYGEVEIERIAKYNPVTGTVSSPCLDPVCNHSLESDCIMLISDGIGETVRCKIKGIFGDWFVFLKQETDQRYSVLNTEVMYNLKTGEARSVYVDDLGRDFLTRWSGGLYFEGKYYNIKCVMDYSNTGYTIGMKYSDYDPVTRRYLYEYDFETDTTKELFEIGSEWGLGRVSNKRFYFRRGDGTCVSLKKDGTDERNETSMLTSNVVGTYTVYYESNGYKIHDLKSDEITEVVYDYPLENVVTVTEKGVLSTFQTQYSQWRWFSAKEYRNQHPNATSEEVNNAARKILAAGVAQIWQCDYTGDNNHIIFELPAADIEIISAYGDYVFAYVSKFNTETGEHLEGYRRRACCINIVTGEVTPIPELDIVVPYWYTN